MKRAIKFKTHPYIDKVNVISKQKFKIKLKIIINPEINCNN